MEIYGGLIYIWGVEDESGPLVFHQTVEMKFGIYGALWGPLLRELRLQIL